MLGLGNMSGTWDLGPHVKRLSDTGPFVPFTAEPERPVRSLRLSDAGGRVGNPRPRASLRSLNAWQPMICA